MLIFVLVLARPLLSFSKLSLGNAEWQEKSGSPKGLVTFIRTMLILSAWNLGVQLLLAAGYSLAHAAACNSEFTELTSGICAKIAPHFPDICSAAEYCVSLSSLNEPVSLIGSKYDLVSQKLNFKTPFWVGIHDLLIPQNNSKSDWQFIDSLSSNRMKPSYKIAWSPNEPDGYAMGEQCTIYEYNGLKDYPCTFNRITWNARAVCQQYPNMEMEGKNIYDSSVLTTKRFIHSLPKEVVDIFGPFSNGCYGVINNSADSLISCAVR
ncbi:unnamed protein product [Protopolystoma xenopodis]|uniref:C-type lectin domain-containing protein n=1 Tax=Protopolystoma xenopodis TaxID=117903 RepID=A0A448X335_9PLAT|nr:unnamed protein product [Protopolystoma xenopodis]